MRADGRSGTQGSREGETDAAVRQNIHGAGVENAAQSPDGKRVPGVADQVIREFGAAHGETWGSELKPIESRTGRRRNRDVGRRDRSVAPARGNYAEAEVLNGLRTD